MLFSQSLIYFITLILRVCLHYFGYFHQYAWLYITQCVCRPYDNLIHPYITRCIRLRQHCQRYQTRLPATYRIARQPIPLYVQRFSAGNMTVPCPHCGSLSFYKEGFNCCHNRKVNLGIYPFPSQLETLFTRTLKEVRTSVKTFADIIQLFHFLPFLQICNLCLVEVHVCFPCGQIYHNYATLYPANNALPPCFNQCYIYQQSEADEFRFLNPVTGGCTPDIFEIISEVLQQVNPYAHWYKTMAEVERNERQLALQEQRPIPIITLHMKTGPERRRYNPPVFSSLDSAPQLHRDIVYPQAQKLSSISYLSPNRDPMAYPLFYPSGEPG